MKRDEDRCIEFMKMSGAGNDFVVLDNRNGIVTDPSTLARKLCDRRKGIGADGLLLLESSDSADFLMQYYNSDGSYGGMCGNGGRCISRYAYVKKIVNRPEIRFEALEHIYGASILQDGVRLKMKDPSDFRIRPGDSSFSDADPFPFCEFWFSSLHHFS
jgi:diaminopimelate epimerase